MLVPSDRVSLLLLPSSDPSSAWRLRCKRFDGMLAQNASASTHMAIGVMGLLHY